MNQMEVLLANDYPEDIAHALLEEGSATDAFVDSCPAVGCLLAGAQAWLGTLWMNEGGSLNSQDDQIEANDQNSGTCETERKKKRRGAPLDSGRASHPPDRSVEQGTSLNQEVSHCGSWQGGLKTRGLKTAQTNLKRARDEPLDTTSSSSGATSSRSTEYPAVDLDQEASGCLKVPANLKLGPSHLENYLTDGVRVSPILSEAAKAIREQKAVKSDDAEVPEHLWEEHLFDAPGWAHKWKDNRKGFIHPSMQGVEVWDAAMVEKNCDQVLNQLD